MTKRLRPQLRAFADSRNVCPPAKRLSLASWSLAMVYWLPFGADKACQSREAIWHGASGFRRFLT
jgi:hypothetical protein